MSQLFVSGGQSIGGSALASVLPENIQDWFPLELTGLISLGTHSTEKSVSTSSSQQVYGTTEQKLQSTLEKTAFIYIKL